MIEYDGQYQAVKALCSTIVATNSTCFSSENRTDKQPHAFLNLFTELHRLYSALQHSFSSLQYHHNDLQSQTNLYKKEFDSQSSLVDNLSIEKLKLSQQFQEICCQKEKLTKTCLQLEEKATRAEQQHLSMNEKMKKIAKIYATTMVAL